MPQISGTDPSSHHRVGSESTGASRRNFLLLIPAALFAGITATLSVAAFRFLRPAAARENVAAAPALWTNVAPLAELHGAKPVMRRIHIEQHAGWASTTQERVVYVLAQPSGHRVLSAVCPHEECTVEWREREQGFFCPCHDSRFAADGARLGGPARRGLDPLQSRVENGVLQVQYPITSDDRSAR
jgi:Rieske Fe-S protein